MENEVSKLIKFWDNALTGKPEAITERWIYEESFLNPIYKYIADGDTILDYGCGMGWLSFELALLKPNLKIVGIDPSSNAIEFNKKCVELSGFKNVNFICGMEDVLANYTNTFNAAISVNTLDVLPIEITKNILLNASRTIKKDGYFIVCINPNYPLELLEKMGYIIKDSYLYKDDILRGLELTKEEWINLFNEYFTFVEYIEFSLTKEEYRFPRRMFILKNNK